MYDFLKDALKVVPIVVEIVLRPRRFLQRHKIGAEPVTSPRYALAYSLGGIGIIVGLFYLIPGQYITEDITEQAESRIREPGGSFSLPNGYPVLYEFADTELIGVWWLPGEFYVGIMAVGETDEATGRIPLVSFQFGPVKATFAKYPSAVFTTKGGQALIVLLYCAMLVICIYPFMKFLGGTAGLADTFKLLIVITSYFIMLAAMLVTGVIFVLLISFPNIATLLGTIGVALLIVMNVRTVILTLSELNRISKSKVIVGMILGAVFSAFLAPILLIPGAFAIAAVHQAFDLVFG